jgi:hypothetical protein
MNVLPGPVLDSAPASRLSTAIPPIDISQESLHDFFGIFKEIELTCLKHVAVDEGYLFTEWSIFI